MILRGREMSKKKIICFTGTRADYGIYRSLLVELEKEESIELQLVVTGMHLLSEYGMTIDEIRKDSFEIIAEPSILFKGDSTYSMTQSVGAAILSFANILNHYNPDGILVLGDRGEMLAAAISAHYQNITTFHLHGGEKSGSADDAIRHAISKLANFHFVSTRKSKANLVQMGVEDSTILVTGSLRKHDVMLIKSISKELKLKLIRKKVLSTTNKRVLFVMHPDSKEKVSYQEQIDSVLSGLTMINDVEIIILGTNSDAGGAIFRKAIKEFSTQKKNVTFIETLPPDEYLYLLSEVNLLLGNSSSGIIEAPFFNLPFINIGNRQRNREQGGNVINVSYESKIIKETTEKILGEGKKQFNNPYDIIEQPAKEIVEHIKKWTSNT